MFGIDKDFQNLMEQVYGPLNKDKEPPDTIEFGGVKYKRVEDTQPFYDKLWGLLKTKLGDSVECDEMADRVRDLIREHIPRLMENGLRSEYICGYNQAIEAINRRLFNGIQ
jgi:hypothetical protein